MRGDYIDTLIPTFWNAPLLTACSGALHVSGSRGLALAAATTIVNPPTLIPRRRSYIAFSLSNSGCRSSRLSYPVSLHPLRDFPSFSEGGRPLLSLLTALPSNFQRSLDILAWAWNVYATNSPPRNTACRKRQTPTLVNIFLIQGIHDSVRWRVA